MLSTKNKRMIFIQYKLILDSLPQLLLFSNLNNKYFLQITNLEN